MQFQPQLEIAERGPDSFEMSLTQCTPMYSTISIPQYVTTAISQALKSKCGLTTRVLMCILIMLFDNELYLQFQLDSADRKHHHIANLLWRGFLAFMVN